MKASLTESWSGPFEVLEKFSDVCYRIRKLESKGTGRVVHLNSLKAYSERETRVCKLIVMAEDVLVHSPLQSEEALNCPKAKLEELLVEFGDVLDNGHYDEQYVYYHIAYLRG